MQYFPLVRSAQRDVATVVVYDDDDKEAQSRREFVEGVLDELTEGGVFVSRPQVVVASLRREVLSALAEASSAILLADLMAYDGAPRGARVLRAVAQREGVRERTWRIAVTLRSSPAVAHDLSGVAHALVVVRQGWPAALAEAITVALERPAADPGPIVVRPEGALERHVKERSHYLRSLLGKDWSPAMERALIRWMDGPFNEVDPEHPTGEPFHLLDKEQKTDKDGADGEPAKDVPPNDGIEWVKVADLQDRLRKQGRNVSTDHLRAEVLRYYPRISDSGLQQKIIPEAVIIALRTATFARLSRHDLTSDQTWLTTAEHEAAMAFLYAALAADEEFGKLASTTETAYAKVDAVYLDPQYRARIAELGLENWDVCYALWTMVDWALDLKEIVPWRAGEAEEEVVDPAADPHAP
jgi:hypothetical protein